MVEHGPTLSVVEIDKLFNDLRIIGISEAQVFAETFEQIGRAALFNFCRDTTTCPPEVLRRCQQLLALCKHPVAAD